MDELTAERIKGWQDVIDYLKGELATQNTRTAGKPKLVARLNTVEATVIKTIINALEEGKETQLAKAHKPELDPPPRLDKKYEEFIARHSGNEAVAKVRDRPDRGMSWILAEIYGKGRSGASVNYQDYGRQISVLFDELAIRKAEREKLFNELDGKWVATKAGVDFVCLSVTDWQALKSRKVNDENTNI